MVKIWKALLFVLFSVMMTTSASSQVLHREQLEPISGFAKKSIQAGKIPGAVILIGNQGKVVYREAFGLRWREPKKIPMTEDTLFDIASLTKVIATSTAVMQLIEKGKWNLDEPVVRYWPEFGRNGKDKITLRHLLTHYSGLRDHLNSKSKQSNGDMILKMIEEEKAIFPPETNFIYSDINFIILGELVSHLTGQPFDLYCAEHIFKPLGMKDTGFNPSPKLRYRIAPTQYQHGTKGKILWGEVHDQTAYSMGGVAGHAGLFSTADDLATFAQMVLDKGNGKNSQILSPPWVEKMITPQSPPDKIPLRGLGWNIDSALISERSFGHKGYTGTGIWIDPTSNTYLIILTNRVHPKGKGDAKPLRTEILSFINETITSNHRPFISHPELEKYKSAKVETGIDVLLDEKFRTLKGLRMGLITNHSGIDSKGRRTVDLLHQASQVTLVSIFSPEHGFLGNAEGKISSTKDPSTGLPIYSLYGDVSRPTQKMLVGLDALVFDIQDAGVRFYTYITTMGYAMEECAKKGIPFYILDRPNPINASLVQGPILDNNLRSFTGYFSLPIRHGMTVGELAKMFNEEMKIGVTLHVIKMRGYERTYWYDETGLFWISPSPNLYTLIEAILYPGVAMVEGSNVSVGRGTMTPFQLLGAPWINGKELTTYLNQRNIKGLRFIPATFTPKSSRFNHQLCQGIQIVLDDRQALDSPALGIEIASALYQLYPKTFQLEKTLGLIGSYEVLHAIKKGEDPNVIRQNWQKPLEEFCKLRSKYLLY
ncbi:MAG: DUF1343 domain-containing protein [Syntrophaceae bacterium]|nr:DUF1343 domain-containing protein [Syntrophaceae bacterium]